MTTSPDITADLISAAVAEIAEQRAVIDQAKGMLTLLYGVDDEAAFDMLRARSQNTNITVRTLAEQLVADYRALVNEEALYEALMSVHERIVATDRTSASPGVSGQSPRCRRSLPGIPTSGRI